MVHEGDAVGRRRDAIRAAARADVLGNDVRIVRLAVDEEAPIADPRLARSATGDAQDAVVVMAVAEEAAAMRVTELLPAGRAGAQEEETFVRDRPEEAAFVHRGVDERSARMALDVACARIDERRRRRKL